MVVLEFDLNDRSECSSRTPAGIPLITILNYSGGKQSSALLWMLIRGDIPTPPRFHVINADPGMEHRETYEYTEMMRAKCADADIDFRTVVGPNLYNDLLDMAGKVRVDNPAFFTQNEDGKEGRLMQKCTKHYKIAPMDREVRRILNRSHGYKNRLRPNMVERWIGFAFDEQPRISTPSQNYMYFRYPLIEMGLTRDDTAAYFSDNNIPDPPRSVCVACFANGTDHYKWQHGNGTDDFARAVKVDDAVRDMTGVGITNPVYVHRSLVALRVMPERDFAIGTTTEERDRFACTSGHCFL